MLVLEREDERTTVGCKADPSAMSRLVATLMDRLESGILACSAQGELLHANLAAQRELRSGGALHVVDGQVRCASGRSEEAWADALQDAAHRHRSRLVSLEAGAQRLMITAMPLPIEGFGSTPVLVMMGRRQVCSALGLEMLASNHGLTLAESRVLRALVGNCTPREIAASHCVSVATVRTQIQSVRDKLGVRSIDALLLRAAEVPPVTARL